MSNAEMWTPDVVVSMLRMVPLFDGLGEDDLERLAEIVEGEAIGGGEVLFEEGDPGEAFFVVFRGAVEIVKSRPDGTEERLAVRRKGEAFGEMALLNEAPRSATARATEDAQLMRIGSENFIDLLGGESLAVQMLRSLSKALRALDIRYAAEERLSDSRIDPFEASRLLQRSVLPRTAPRVPGWDLAAGTILDDAGRGASVWDAVELGARSALLVYNVHGDGLPPGHLLSQARTLVREAARELDDPAALLAEANGAMARAAVDGMEQAVSCGILVLGDEGIQWVSAGKVPGGILGREGTFTEFAAGGPPLGMLEGLRYGTQDHTLGTGDCALALSHASQGLFRGAADLVASLHGKPAGEVVKTVHRALQKAHGDEAAETSVLFVRRQ